MFPVYLLLAQKQSIVSIIFLRGSMLKPISWRNLIRRLKKLGFVGPVSGGKHLFMLKANFYLKIPNPHGADISKELLAEILRQAGIRREIWNNLQ